MYIVRKDERKTDRMVVKGERVLNREPKNTSDKYWKGEIYRLKNVKIKFIFVKTVL